MNKRFYISTLLYLLLMLSPDTAKTMNHQEYTIHVYPENEVSTEYIYLRDIADITGDEQWSEETGAIKLGLSPRVGKKKEYTGQRLTTILRSRTSITDDFEIITPEIITIRKASYRIEEEEIKQVLYDFIRLKNHDYDIDINQIKIRGNLLYPAGKIELVISNRETVKSYGRVSIYIDVYLNSLAADTWDTPKHVTRKPGRLQPQHGLTVIRMLFVL